MCLACSITSAYVQSGGRRLEPALKLGHHDSRVTFAHYRELVKPKDAERYWIIRHSKDSEDRAAYGSHLVPREFSMYIPKIFRYLLGDVKQDGRTAPGRVDGRGKMFLSKAWRIGI